jgi:hypothetical protein
MTNKLSGFQVDFSIANLSMNEQEKIYNLLVKNLTFQQKDNLHICITDPIGGKHYIYEDTGIMPNGINCDKCYNIECARCKSYIKEEERKKD